AARLERACALKELGLEERAAGADPLGERGGAERRRSVEAVADRLARREDVAQRDREPGGDAPSSPPSLDRGCGCVRGAQPARAAIRRSPPVTDTALSRNGHVTLCA